jgi:hypothetical protein
MIMSFALFCFLISLMLIMPLGLFLENTKLTIIGMFFYLLIGVLGLLMMFIMALVGVTMVVRL